MNPPLPVVERDSSLDFLYSAKFIFLGRLPYLFPHFKVVDAPCIGEICTVPLFFLCFCVLPGRFRTLCIKLSRTTDAFPFLLGSFLVATSFLLGDAFPFLQHSSPSFPPSSVHDVTGGFVLSCRTSGFMILWFSTTFHTPTPYGSTSCT